MEVQDWFFELVLFSFLFCISFSTNSLVLLIFHRRPVLRTASNKFVINLLISNVLSVLVITIALFGQILAKDSFDWKGLGDAASFAGSWQAVCLVMMIAIDQHLAISDPLRSHTRLLQRRSTLLCAFTWIGAAVVAAIQVTIAVLRHYYPLDRFFKLCQIAYYIGYLVIGVLPPLIIVCVMYSRIYRAARSSGARARAHGVSVLQLHEPQINLPDLIEEGEGLTLRIDIDPDNFAVNVADNVAINVADNVAINVADNVAENVAVNVADNFADNVAVNVAENVADNVTDNVAVNVADNVAVNVADNVAVNVADNVAINVADNVAGSSRKFGPFLLPPERPLRCPSVSSLRNARKEDESSEDPQNCLPSVSSAPSLAAPLLPAQSGQIITTNSSRITSIRSRISNASLFQYREESRAARVGIMTAVVVMLHLPHALIIVLSVIFPGSTTSFRIPALALLLLASVVSPFLFALRSRRIQREARSLFRPEKSPWDRVAGPASSSAADRQHASASELMRTLTPGAEDVEAGIPVTAPERRNDVYRCSFSSGASTQMSSASDE